MNQDTRIDELCKTALENIQLSDVAVLRIQSALHKELREIDNAPPKPIMTMSEIINYLRIEPDVFEDYLGDIPCFELGGKLLFRKEAVDEWIESREKLYAYEITDFKIKKDTKFSVA